MEVFIMNGGIKLLAMDVDGTLTDGKIYISGSGELFKAFNVKDGYAINMLKEKGVKTAIVTARNSNITYNRALELGIDYVRQNVKLKLQCISDLASELNIGLKAVAFIGDDVPDLECIKSCGCSGCPADAADIIKENAKYVCKLNGGCGAVREFVEYVLRR